ncbi:extracellular solute-binding protein [Haloechinothrix sp. LS1_15]|uniref:extracellular solute-binding protein n=1 Tax=Haloechinothrix sp. LS1_15 TaxID=2652248 RepID=UPI002947F4B5|nr:extracellular solute-binding protein [Haloechinothrix sp. LS1_15]MDV6011566.1 extracellular solute-binding protein [Haloechinothrix sp. LS1_15]
MTRQAFRRLGAVAFAAALFVVLVACGTDVTGDTGEQAAEEGGGQSTLTIYSGRNEELVGGILEHLEDTTGYEIEVRYGDSAELAAQLLEEGDRTDADLFFSQNAGALGALREAGMLRELPERTLEVAPERFRASDGTWVGTSARARVVVYDPDQVDVDDVPGSIDELVDETWEGEVGYAPSNASWQSFVTALRVLDGEQAARDWLMDFRANEPEAFESNTPILEAVDSGEIALGLINHYYHQAWVTERGAGAVNAERHHPDGGDALGLVNVAGVGVLDTSEAPEAAVHAIDFLLSGTAQQYFADETAEYPMRQDVTSTRHELGELDELPGPDIDLSRLSTLDDTLELLRDVGLSS